MGYGSGMAAKEELEHLGNGIWINREKKTIHLGSASTVLVDSQARVDLYRKLASIWEEEEND